MISGFKIINQSEYSSVPHTPQFHTKKGSPKNSQKTKKAIGPKNFQDYATNEELVNAYDLFFHCSHKDVTIA